MKTFTPLALLLLLQSTVAFAQIEQGRIRLNAGAQFTTATTDKIETSGYTDPLMKQNNFTTSGTDHIGVSFYLSGGYFIKPNLEVGIAALFGTSSSITPQAFDKTTGNVYQTPPQTANVNTVLFDNRTASQLWGVGVYASKYFAIGSSNKWFWKMTGSMMYRRSTNSITDIYAYDPGKLGAGTRPAQYQSREKDDPNNPNENAIDLGFAPGIDYFIGRNWAIGASLGNVLLVSYAATSYTTETYINNGAAGGYPTDVDKISRTYSGNVFNATAQLPFVNSGGVMISLAYFLK